MSVRYIFPCSKCDHKFELVNKQAGQTLTCPECGAKTDAPRLGTLKTLETVGDTPEAKSSKGSGSGGSTKNLLFVLGLGLAILAGTAGFFLYQHASSKMVEVDIEGFTKAFSESVDEQPPSQLIEFYTKLNVDLGLPEWKEQSHVGENKQAGILQGVSMGLFGLAGVGVLMLLSSLFIRK